MSAEKAPEGFQPKTMQVGHKEGRVLIAVDGTPIAAFYPPQVAILVAQLTKHAWEIVQEGYKRILDDAEAAKDGKIWIPPPPTGPPVDDKN